MRIIQIFNLLAILSIALLSCSPKVTTNILKSYPPLPQSEEVTLYDNISKIQPPANMEPLGQVSVTDNGYSTEGSYPQVVNLAVAETRKIGGKGLLITDHKEPSFWGSSIHQIAGTMLRVSENDNLSPQSNTAYIGVEENIKHSRIPLSVHTFALNGGYGIVVNRTKGISGTLKGMENKLSNGLDWDAQYILHPKGNSYGIGLIYSQYCSSPFSDVVYDNRKYNLNLDYIGLNLAYRGYLSPKWIGGVLVGFGYLGMTEKLSNSSNQFGALKGATVGTYYDFGIEYKLAKNFGIAADLSWIGGSISSVKYDSLTLAPGTPEISSENRIGVSRVNFTLGVRCYL